MCIYRYIYIYTLFPKRLTQFIASLPAKIPFQFILLGSLL